MSIASHNVECSRAVPWPALLVDMAQMQAVTSELDLFPSPLSSQSSFRGQEGRHRR